MRKIYTKENQAEKFGWVKTSEKIEVTFNGWDGKSYDGESKKMNVWVDEKFHPGKKFVYKRQGGFSLSRMELIRSMLFLRLQII